jgi:hypothetical protein
VLVFGVVGGFVFLVFGGLVFVCVGFNFFFFLYVIVVYCKDSENIE